MNIFKFPKYYKLINESIYFDKSWYRKKYKNFFSANFPVIHYLINGKKQGINPSEHFLGYEYLFANPDVKKAGINPLLHFEIFGKSENREIIKFDHLLRVSSTCFKNINTQPRVRESNEKNKPEIKIFIPCNTDSFVPDNELLKPIQTGTALNPIRFENMLYDDQGENISSRNEAYSELTAHYWAWKNFDADYYGFFHNRRYLSFNRIRIWETKNIGIEIHTIDKNAIEKIRLYEEEMRDLIERYDIILPKRHSWLSEKKLGTNRNILHQYEISTNHEIKDLLSAIDILKRQHPEYGSAADNYLLSYEGFYYNIFIMRKELFFNYCEWLFPILDELYRNIDFSLHDSYSKRVIGFISERLFGIFILFLIENNPDLRICELQNTYFKNVNAKKEKIENQVEIKDHKLNVKIFQSHRIDVEGETINNPLFYPVRSGAIFDKKQSKIPGDDTGENISEKYLKYNELTVHYWAFKNYSADYYGLFNYNMMLSFSPNNKLSNYNNKFYNLERIDEHLIKTHYLEETHMRNVIEKFDIISSMPLDLNEMVKGLTVYEYFLKNEKVFKTDILDLFINIFKYKYPEYSYEIDSYFYGHIWRGHNCYILKKEYFHEYSKILFDLLFELEKKLNYKNFNSEQMSIIGYMGEYVFGVYLNKLIKSKKINYLELPLIKIIHPEKKIYYEPRFEENYIVLIVASSDLYVPFLIVLFQSIFENMTNSNNYDIIVISDGITDVNKEKIKNFQNHYKNISIRFIESYMFISNNDLYSRDHIKSTTYLRLFISDILRNFEKAIYLDCDVVVNTDIAELYNVDLENYLVAGVIDTVMAGWCNSRHNNQDEYNQLILGLKNKFDYFNAGVLLFNLKQFRRLYSSSDLLSIAKIRNWRWFDQDILNVICEGYVKYLDNSWNFMAHVFESEKELPEYYAPKEIFENYLKTRLEPKIVHYAGSVMPSFQPKVDCSEFFWKYAQKTNIYENLLLENKYKKIS